MDADAVDGHAADLCMVFPLERDCCVSAAAGLLVFLEDGVAKAEQDVGVGSWTPLGLPLHPELETIACYVS